MPPKKSSESINKTLEETSTAILKRLESIDSKFDQRNTCLTETKNIAYTSFSKSRRSSYLGDKISCQ